MKNFNQKLVAVILIAALFASITASAAESSEGTININTATSLQLSYLPGIGPSKAEAIISHRSKRPFKKVEDLMRIKGIGRKTFKKLRPYLAVKGETTIKKKIKVSK